MTTDTLSISDHNPDTLRKKFGIRLQHFYELNGHLLGTIASRLVPGSPDLVDVAHCLANETQGKVKPEELPNKKRGRQIALDRLSAGNKDQRIFTPTEARQILDQILTGEDYRNPGITQPKEIKVIRFKIEELQATIRNRTILNYFPGQKWLRPMKPRAAYVARKNRTGFKAMVRRLVRMVGLK